MSKTVQEIADFVGGVVAGDAQGVVIGLSGIKEAQPGTLTFIANSKYLPLLNTTQATAILCPPDLAAANKTLIHCDNPSLAFAKVVPLFVDEQAQRSGGIHPTAVISPEAELGADVSVGPYTVIENGVTIGDRTVIMSGCFIGHHTRIGADGLIHPRVTIRERIRIGQRVIIHSGAVIGSDGFGFANVAGRHEKIPQIGIVEIEDDVEIGANVTIDRARFDTTLIGQGTKIDNLVQIAHNVRIGKNCLIVAQVGISGSTVIEDNVILAGQAGLAGHLTIGAGAIVGAQAGVTESVDPGIMVSGYPARPHRHAKRVNACVQRLPGYIKTLNELKKRIEELEARTGQAQDGGGAADGVPAENS